MQYEQTNFTQRIKLTAASIKKNSREIPGRIIRPGGRIIRPPRNFHLQLAAANNLIDRGKEVIQHDSWESRTTSGGLNTKQKTWINSYKALERGDEQYPDPLRKRLGESPPKVEEIKSRQNPAKGMAGAPVAAAERRRRQERTGGLGLELPGGQPNPPPFIPGRHSGRIIRLGWPG
jgi:hypothetical protein